jgi:hypothetical protein
MRIEIVIDKISKEIKIYKNDLIIQTVKYNEKETDIVDKVVLLFKENV